MALKAKIAAASSYFESNVEPMAPPQRLITPQEQLQLQLQSQEERERSLNLIIDSDGRTIDKRTGELVQIQSRLPTLKANIQAKKRDIDSKIKKNASSQDLFASGIASTISGLSSVFTPGITAMVSQIPKEETPEAGAFFDPRLKLKTAERNKRSLKFSEQGVYVDLANKLRTKSKLQQLQKEIASISKKTGISSDSRLALIQPKRISVSVFFT